LEPRFANAPIPLMTSQPPLLVAPQPFSLYIYDSLKNRTLKGARKTALYAIDVVMHLKTLKMKKINLTICILVLPILQLLAQERCLTTENLKKLDASWEKAQLELDFDTLDSLLAEDFIWVHNHANTIDNKTAVLERVNRYLKSNNRNTKSRISKDVKVIILGATGIVSGYTVVDRGPVPTTYKFMRTYVETNGKCYLLANQTMAIPENEKD